MKIKTGYLLRDIAGQTIVVPIGAEAVRFNGIVTLNKTGKVLWNALQNEQNADDLVRVLLNQFEVEEATAKNDVSSFVEKLKKANLLE
jgi:sensor domain CHASE-containing protein